MKTYRAAIIYFLFFHLLLIGAARAGRAPEERLLDQAVKDFQAKRYDSALEQSRAILNQPALTEAVRDRALRLAADANYSLGLKGDVQSLLTAIDQYKMILQYASDPVQENDLLYYRMAMGYEKLHFNYEAMGAFERLILSYPESAYLPEAMFKIGDLLHQTAKFNRAIERLLVYVKKYPGGKYAKLATVTIGDCYLQMQKRTFASQWYDEAREHWSDMADIPHALLINMGNHYFEVGRFGPALDLYSLFVNVFPHNEFSKKAFSMMASSLERMDETALALHIYRLFLEKYPGSKESEACSLSMANLGVSKPRVKFPIHVLDINDYREPMESYDRLMAKNPVGEQAAAVLLGKGNALVKYGRLQEGVDVYLELLSRFPQSDASVEGRGKMNLHIRSLVGDYGKRGDHLAVAEIYFRGAGQGLSLADDFETASIIGESLIRTGLYDEALSVYLTLKKMYKDKEDKITLALAQIDAAKEKHAEAEEKLAALLKKGTTKDHGVLKEAKTALADLYFKTGHFTKANFLYEDILSTGGGSHGRIYLNYGRSLHSVNMNKKAIVHYLKALKDYEQQPQKYTTGLLADLYTGLGDAYYGEHSHEEGISAYRQALTYVKDVNVRGWLLSAIGNGFANLGDFSEAEKSFIQLKDSGSGEFWPKVADYLIAKGSDGER